MFLAFTLFGTACSTGPEPAGQQEPAASAGRPLEPAPDVQLPGFTNPPAGSGLQRYESQLLQWSRCQEGLQCATVLVPLDYGRPDGTAITVTMAKKPASADRRLGTLFINPGGPGASGVDYLDSFRSEGLEGYDIIGWDPRGVSRSTPVSCAGVDLDAFLSLDVSPDDAQEQDALVQADRDLGRDCLQRSGPLLEHVSTVEVVRDLDLARGLVGDPKLNLYGGSYATQIGATYAQLFPARVGRMVLDGAVNITEDTSVTQAVGFERALTAFADWCAGKRCPLGSTREQVLAAVRGLWTGLDGDPLRVGSRQLSQQQAVFAVVGRLYGPPDGYPDLMQGLQNAILSRDGRLLLAFADAANYRDPRGRYGQINYAFPAIRCLDQHDHGVQGEIDIANRAATAAPTMAPFFGPDLQCAQWPVPPVPRLKLVGAGAPPIVVIGTTGDPATPYEYAVSMAKQLESGVLVTYRGVGHTAYGQSPCVQRLVDSYLVNGVVPRDGTVC
jgi:pimeloyl-ACP methyl ester carboxylesterase